MQGCEIKITVTKTELLKKPIGKSNVLNEHALNLLGALKQELINLFGGLSESQQYIGYWVNNEGVTERDLNVDWLILTDKQDLETLKRLNQICLAIKLVTKQKAQLVTIKKDVEIIYLTENL